MNDIFFMQEALKQASIALESGEFPVGCIIADGGKIWSTGRRAHSRDSIPSETAHAEIIALDRLQSIHPLPEASPLTLYTTMEPCLMCFGAILLSRVTRLVYAYEDVMGGGTGIPLATLAPLYRERKMEIVPNVLREQSIKLFKAFFSNPDNAYWRNSRLSQYTLDI